MIRNQFRRAAVVATVVLTYAPTAAACSSGGSSSSGGRKGGTVGGVVGGAAGGSVGGAAAVGGAAGAIEVPTEVVLCKVDFSPDPPTNNNQAMGMTWGDGQITFNVSMSCPKAMSRGTLAYSIFFTGASNPRIDIGPSKPFNLAGIQNQSFTYVQPCKPGMYIFEYRWEAAVDGASNEKQDANTSAGVFLTSYNCKSKVP